jgi:hypothetical protein
MSPVDVTFTRKPVAPFLVRLAPGDDTAGMDTRFDMLQRHPIFAHRGDPHALLASLGFRPACLDCSTMTIYLCGRVMPPMATLTRGYERNGYFFTLATAARAAREWLRPA